MFENSKELVEKYIEPIEKNNEMVTNGISQIENVIQQIENDIQPIENYDKILENDSQVLENELKEKTKKGQNPDEYSLKDNFQSIDENGYQQEAEINNLNNDSEYEADISKNIHPQRAQKSIKYKFEEISQEEYQKRINSQES